MASQDVHIPIPGTFEYVTLQGSRDFIDVIGLRILKWVIILDYLGEPRVITKAFIRGRQGTSLMVRWVRLRACVPQLRVCMLQLRVHMPLLRSPHAATKILHATTKTLSSLNK